MEDLIQDIQNRLLEKVSALKGIDEDWGQLDFYSQNPPIKFPCALVDAVQVNWSGEARQIQTGLVQVKITLADWRLSNSNVKAPQSMKDKAFSIRELDRQIFTALQGWSGARKYSKLIRVSTLKVKVDGWRKLETVYTTQYFDASAVPIKNEIDSPQIAMQTNLIVP